MAALLALVLPLAGAVYAPRTADIGCGFAATGIRPRRVCFGDAEERDLAPGGFSRFTVPVTVTVDGEPSCGDALRVRFASPVALFAPRLHEVRCGVHELDFVLPADAPSYEPEVVVVHVSGEGMKDPAYPRLYPLNLAGYSDGPMVYNARATGFSGTLNVSAAYRRKAAQAVGRQPSAVSVCTDASAPGRWVHSTSLYPMFQGETLEWKPYGCDWPLVTGSRLRSCLENGRTKLVGESTLGELYEMMLMHMNVSSYYWPMRMPVADPRQRFSLPFLKAEGEHGEWHGLSTMLDFGSVEEQLRTYRPTTIVHLQAANDAARDTFERYKQRLAEYADVLVRVYAQEPPRLVWITSAARHYKAGNGPGSASCLGGTVESCRSVSSGTSYTGNGRPHDSVVWRYDQAAPPFFYGTLDRRRAFNAWAVKYMRSRFPALETIDFEAVTEALPSDFNIDGEHMGCNFIKWQDRHREPYQCRSLGVQVLANILSNVLCSGTAQTDA